MELLYWIGEFLKVFIAYMIIMYAWPEIVFRKYLRGKSVIFHFSFCVTTQVVLLNSIVITLGLIKVLDLWVFRGVFWGILAVSILKDVRITDKNKRFFRYFITGTMGVKNLFYKIRTGIKNGILSFFHGFRALIKGHVWENFLLAAVVIYGMIYFDYGSFQDFSFGTGDLYPHVAWVYGLIQGKPFSAGIYPEGMHCLIYSIHCLFGVKLYSVMLFLQSVHVHVFLLSVYIFFRTVFKWNYTPLIVMTAFLTLDATSTNMVACFARLQWTIPQEFALNTPFLCAAYMIQYLQAKPLENTREKKLKKLKPVREKHKLRSKLKYLRRKRPFAWLYQDENLYIFTMSLATSIVVHFYPAIMVFVFCASFVAFMLYRLFAKGKLKPLIGAGITALMIAVIPMGAAFATGIPFQGSIGWALEVMGVKEKPGAQQESTKENTEQKQDASSGDSGQEKTENDQTGQNIQPSATDLKTEENTAASESLVQKVIRVLLAKIQGILNRLPEIGEQIYTRCYVYVFQEQRAKIVLYAAGAGMCLWGVYRILTAGLYLIKSMRKVVKPAYFDQYAGLILVAQIFMIMASPTILGLPVLIDTSRLCALEQLLELGVVAIILDMAFSLFQLFLPSVILKTAALAGIVSVVYLTWITDSYHGYLYWVLTRYNSAVAVTNAITDKLPRWSYTIVSTTDELYQQIQYGWHEEQVHFINESADEAFTLPTEYVFIFLEKKALRRNQYHVFTGPEWLAWSKYFQEIGNVEIVCYDYDESLVMVPGAFLSENSGTYAHPVGRQIVQATTKDWLETFDRKYPNELKLFYEDDYFACYYFKQNVNRLYKLGVREYNEDSSVLDEGNDSAYSNTSSDASDGEH